MAGFRGTSASSGVRTLALALASVGLAAGVPLAQAATIGHARLVSGPGEPLRIVVPVHQVPASEAETLRVSIPQAPDWAAAGLSPPVALDSLGFDIAPGFAPNTRLITLRSSQSFSAPVVDLLIDVSSASGRQRHQVSLLAPAGAVVSAPVTASAGAEGNAQGRQVRVREGDNLFGIARRNAVPGVSVYQMMVGLYQQNSSAFIQKNLNLVRAGATLRVPDRATLTAISDREARRIFDQHARAFALYRNRLAATPDVVAAPSAEQAAGGQVQPEPSAAPAPVAEQPPSDRLRLSGAVAGNGQAAPGSTQGVRGSGSGSVNGGNGAGNGAVRGAGVGISNGATGGGNGSPSGSVLGSAQAAAPAYAGAADDDRVAQERALGDARSRVTELEDTVRELRDALADITGAGSAGPAAGSSAAAPATPSTSPSGAVETAAQSRVDRPADAGRPAAQAGATGTGELSGQSRQAPAGAAATGKAPTAGTTGLQTGEPATASAGGSSTGGAASGSGAAETPTDGSTLAAASRPGDAASEASGNGSVTPATSGADGATGADAAASGTASGAATSAAPSQASAASGSNGPASPATTASPATAGQGTQTDNRARQVAEPITEKAEKTVSWLQENLIAIGGGVLALIVLFVLWLLRRSGKPDDDGENAITEAMIREKLEKIDLDLSSSSDAGNSRER